MQGYTGGAALGMFAMGCSPGGGASNLYSHLLGGDISVSITMTLLSTILSLGKLFVLYDETDGEDAFFPFTA